MPLLWIALLLALLTGTWLSVQSDHATSSAELAEVDTLARSLLLYRSSLAEYAHANPGFTGLPADSALGLPAWFRKPARLQGYIAAGTSYAFIASPPAGLAAAVDAGTESDLGWRQAQRPVSHAPPRSHCHCAPCAHPRGRGGRGQVTSTGQ